LIQYIESGELEETLKDWRHSYLITCTIRIDVSKRLY